ncbi:hypothetical protein Hanom_Chr11g00987411 [Helianthus anomalus]
MCRSLKTNNLFLVDYRGLIHLFSYRCLQMWSADCRRFTSEKTNSTLVFICYIYPTYMNSSLHIEK